MSINGFEILTAELSHYEQEVLLPKIVAGLATKKGKELAITNKKICKGMKERGMTITEVRVRKLVNYIRTHDLLPGLIATSAGYYVTEDPVELAKYIDSLRQRKNEIGRVEESMKSYLRILINKAS
jgi:hypothetical protein